MRLSRSLAAVTVCAIAVASAALAFEPAGDMPTTKPAMKETAIRLTVPWSKVKDLSDDQKKQINDIHVYTVAKIKALEADEDDKCMAILTDGQRKALQETLDQEKADKKAAKGK